MMHRCLLCGHDATDSHLLVSLQPTTQPRFKVCSACSLLAVRQGYAVVYHQAA